MRPGKPLDLTLGSDSVPSEILAISSWGLKGMKLRKDV